MTLTAAYVKGPSRAGKNTQSLKYETIEQRLLRLSRQDGDCRLWIGALRNGYGIVTLPNRGGPKMAHRAAYETWIGPIPEGLTLDHLCRARACIEPTHLEPVSMAENIYRGISPSATNRDKRECHKGHPLADSNLLINSEGRRICLLCRRAYQREWTRQRRAK